MRLTFSHLWSRTATAAAVSVLVLTGCSTAGSEDLIVGEPAAPAADTTTPAAASPAPVEKNQKQAKKQKSNGNKKENRGDKPAAKAGTAAAVLATLAVKGRAPKTGYSRDMFGPAWLDTDRNGCGTRDDMLAEHLTNVRYRPGSNCVVVAGVLADQYTGTQIVYERGSGPGVDIDHVVALSNSWQTGSARWSMKKRAAFANDPLNLLPAQAAANRQKGDGDAATWLPANKSFRCDYVARQVAVKSKYGLWVTRAEHAAISRVLNTCPNQRITADVTNHPVEAPVTVTKPTRKTAPVPNPTTPPANNNKGGPGTGTGGTYKNCTEARELGGAPVHRGQPGYGTHLDRDGDGIACE